MTVKGDGVELRQISKPAETPRSRCPAKYIRHKTLNITPIAPQQDWDDWPRLLSGRRVRYNLMTATTAGYRVLRTTCQLVVLSRRFRTWQRNVQCRT